MLYLGCKKDDGIITIKKGSFPKELVILKLFFLRIERRTCKIKKL